MTNTNKLSISPVITALEESFDYLNNRFYDGVLPRPVIVMTEGKQRAMGWFTVGSKANPDAGKVWHGTDGESHANELNVASDYLNRGFEHVVETLAHEMVHCFNDANGIQDCARSGSRHNKKFKEAAEAHGMVWNAPTDDPDSQADYKRVGYARVSLREDVKDEVYEALSGLKEALTLYRDRRGKEKKATSKKSNVIKYMCPCCGNSVRATKEVAILCADCEERMLPSL